MKKLFYILLFLPLFSMAQPTGVSNLWILPGALQVTGDVTYSYTHAVVSMAAGVTYTPTIATMNVPVKLLPTFTSIEADNCVVAGDTIKVNPSGDYFVRMYGNFASSNNDDITINCRLNNSLTVIASYQGSGTSTSNFTPIAYEWYFKDVTANTYISFWIRNTTNANDPIIRDLRVIVSKVPEN